MKHLIIYIATALSACVLAGCSSSWDEAYADDEFLAVTDVTLSLSQTALQFSADGERQQVNVSTEGYWSATTSASWVTLQTSGTALSVTAQANPTENDRSATITVNNGVGQQSITVTQQGQEKPTVGDAVVYGITSNSASCRFMFQSAGVAITEWGVCYGTNTLPDVSGTHRSYTGSLYEATPDFSLSGLSSKTRYYVRPYVVSVLGTHYGNAQEFTTKAAMPDEGDNGMPQD